ncbi:SHSP domain-containing protein [Trichostrongylus colubriformis]|uniref:SHSP domain-containing protein n=1 Tax=Trichostrongylus colubriformis TaxID=6319 RepID=A0AAN8FWQ2_TRICO
MDLWPWPHKSSRLMREMMDDFDRFERRMFPYWREADRSIYVGHETQKPTNDDKKFAVSLNVSHFRPEELNVHVEGRELTIEGKQEQKDANSYVQRSFVRKWILPDDVDMQAIRTQLDDKGQLSIEAPKGASVQKEKEENEKKQFFQEKEENEKKRFFQI